MSSLAEAADAIKPEYRRASATVELKCRGVEPVGDTGQIFRLDVGAFADFDWTWEGARAFKGTPWGLDEAEAAQAGQGQWSGDVVEVDKDAGLLFVHRDSAEPPRTGSFLVKPYGFLEALNAIHNGAVREHLAELLAERLPLALGRPPGVPLEGSDPGLESLAGVWRMPWGILWGPPGMGKTWTIGQQVAEHLAGGGDRILVVSTTNKATDGMALAIGRALQQRGQAVEGGLWVGSGSNIRPFEREGLEQMLKCSAAELRRQLAELIKRYEATGRAEERAELFQQIQAVRKELREAAPFLDEKTRAIVCTAHHAAQQLATAEIAQAAGEDDAPFDTVIVDEAGLVSRAAAAALSCLGQRRFLLVGDPCQLAPISQMSRILTQHRGTYARGWKVNFSGTRRWASNRTAPSTPRASDSSRRRTDTTECRRRRGSDRRCEMSSSCGPMRADAAVELSPKRATRRAGWRQAVSRGDRREPVGSARGGRLGAAGGGLRGGREGR